MALPNNEQYIRGMALESAVRLIASPNFLGMTDPTKPEKTQKDLLLDLADQFADYIQYGRESDAS